MPGVSPQGNGAVEQQLSDERHASEQNHSLVAVELATSTSFLIRLRWLAGAGVLLGAFLIGPVLGLGLPMEPLWVTGLMILAYNLVFYQIDRRLEATSAPPDDYKRLAFAQVALDWIAMLPLIYFSGGIESPVVYFFVFHILIAAIFISRTAGFVYTFLATLLLAGIALAEYYQFIPESSLSEVLPLPLNTAPLYILAVLVFFGATGLIITTLAATISERLRRREREVEQLNQELRRSSARLRALNESARVINSTLELSEVLNRLVENTAHVMDVHACSIRLLDESGDLLEPVAVYGLSQAYLDKGPLELENDPLDRQVLQGEIVHIPDVTQSSLLQYPEWAMQEGIQSMLSAPLIGKRGPLGVLRAYCIHKNHFTHDEQDYLSAIASQGSIAIENALAYRQIESLDATKTTFMRVFTHELRSPVSVTRSLLQTLAAGYAGELDEGQMDLVARAIRRVDFLAKLIDDLLELAANRVPVKGRDAEELVPLAALLEQVVSRFQVPAQERRLSLEWIDESEGEDTRVRGTQEGLDRVFNNLISNAVKYTPDGGRVTVRLKRGLGQACVTVQDTGIGIPAGSMPRLFDEFYRAPNARLIEHEGTGLGLAIVKELVNNYKGDVKVESEEGVGSCFTVTLPLAG